MVTPVTAADVLANVTRNFARQDEKESARSMLDRAANVRRGTIRAVQQSLQPMEARTAVNQPATSLTERLERRRIVTALESRLPGLAERVRRHGESVARLARAGASLADRVAEIARRARGDRRHYRESWRDVAARATEAPEAVERQSRTHQPGRRR